LVCQGRVYHGAPPGEVEVGHLRLDQQGTIVEQRCSGWAVNRHIREAVATSPIGPLAERVAQDPGHEARHLLPALAQHDPTAERILAATADDLAFALSHVTHLLHPAVIVLGGGLARLGETLRAAVAKRLPDRIMAVFQPGPAIVLAELGADAVPVGALLLALQAAGPKV
jgi:glucokinase